jgi:hypothetical protein
LWCGEVDVGGGFIWVAVAVDEEGETVRRSEVG